MNASNDSGRQLPPAWFAIGIVCACILGTVAAYGVLFGLEYLAERFL